MPASDPTRLLLASIHDVTPRFESEIDRLCAVAGERLGGARFAMLVVPDHWDQAPLEAAPGFRRKLRDWADQGVEMFVHGWCHRDDSRRHAGAAGLAARFATAGEGEFLGLARDEALCRMLRGRAVVEQAIGRPVAGFIAPAWLYGAGAGAALAEAGFAIAEDHFRVWRPADGTTLARGPVVTWATRSRVRIASSLGFAALARAALAPLPVVRIGLHPGDVRVPAVLASVEATLAHFGRSRRAARYADLKCGKL